MTHLFTSGLSIGQDDLGHQTLALLQSLTSDDDLWVLGTAEPFFPEALELSSFSTISARLHLIRGAHDHETLVSRPIWSSASFMEEITVDGQLIVLCCFPLMTWPQAEEDTALRYSGLKEGTHYVCAPGMDLQVVRDGRISGANPRLFSK